MMGDETPHRCRRRSAGGGGGGLVPPTETGEGWIWGDSYVPFVAAHRKNMVEGWTIGDQVEGSGTFKRLIAEGMVFSDTVSAKLFANTTEGMVWGDTWEGVFKGIRHSEGMVWGDEVTETTPKLVAKLTEGIVWGDSPSAKGTYSKELTEGSILGDSWTPEATSKHDEGWNWGDEWTATQSRHRTDVMLWSDSYTTFQPGIGTSEGMVWGDQYSPLTKVSLTEGMVWGDTPKHVIHVNLDEGWVWRDTLDHEITIGLAEGMKIGDELKASKISAHLTEGWTFGESFGDAFKMPASLTEGWVWSDLPKDNNEVAHSEGLVWGDDYSRFTGTPTLFADDFSGRSTSQISTQGYSKDLSPTQGDTLTTDWKNPGQNFYGNYYDFDFDDSIIGTLQNWSVDQGTAHAQIDSPNWYVQMFQGAQISRSFFYQYPQYPVMRVRVSSKCKSAGGGTLKVRLDGEEFTITATGVEPSFTNWSFTSNLGSTGSKNVEIEADTGNWDVDNIHVTADEWFAEPMPYFLKLASISGRWMQITNDKLIVQNPSGSSNQISYIGFHLSGADSGNPNWALGVPTWGYIHATVNAGGTGSRGVGLCLGTSKANILHKYWGTHGDDKIMGNWTITGTQLTGSPYQKALPSGQQLSSEIEIYFKITSTPSLSKFAIRDIPDNRWHFTQNWALNSWGGGPGWNNFGLGVKGSGTYAEFHEFWVTTNTHPPPGFPNLVN